MAITESDRIVRINVRLMPHIKQRLDDYAKHVGMAGSTIVAFLIADFLDAKERQQNTTKDMAVAMTPAIFEHLQQLTSTPEGRKQLELLAGVAEASSGESLDS